MFESSQRFSAGPCYFLLLRSYRARSSLEAAMSAYISLDSEKIFLVAERKIEIVSK
jgi:hypothetical protein